MVEEKKPGFFRALWELERHSLFLLFTYQYSEFFQLLKDLFKAGCKG